ncbi:kunitz-type serine protease inhibitor bitisilin-3-like [Hyposmocoma kahamanoa]|uniref:kunitz-type serine protease inhibitor bitisilin-3-like n=1 Tax=Hyposmocoma kahamanoa TaxID=1477025 RepID=UPI000E6D9A7B|nr:kunitz-type serine protease inhibitor bitisilin-3-like [Hyposmocoma kahamanoa]
MYYFDPAAKNCSAFTWGGCQGNGNRFDTEEDCLGYCLTHENERPKPPSYCSLTFDYGYCFGSVERWYFDTHFKLCQKTIYSGCGGNNNNFGNEAMCNKICTFNSKVTTLRPKRITDNIKRIVIINPHDSRTTSTTNSITRSKVTNNNRINNRTRKTTVPDENVTTRKIYIPPYSPPNKWGFWRRGLPYNKKNQTS